MRHYPDWTLNRVAGLLADADRFDLLKLEIKDGYWLTWPEERARSKR